MKLIPGERKDPTTTTTTEEVERVLEQYGIHGKVTSSRTGPTITIYEFIPVPGTKVSAFTSMPKNLELALGISGISIQAPIPNRNVVGIFIPNRTRMPVHIADVLKSPEYRDKSLLLGMALGARMDGQAVVPDLAELPHLLIAGTTGSGKSCAMHSIICSLMLRYSPDELKFVMLDPKGTELSVYNTAPHMAYRHALTSVGRMAIALQCGVEEMEQRYRKFTAVGARDLKEFNERSPEKMYRIIFVVDELADLMLQAKKTVEGLLTRLAQKARACGIHLIVATQRPTANIITGLIKANFPARLALKTMSKLDSRIILDASGAEALLGRGDAIFSDGCESVRLQCCLINSQEIINVCANLRVKYPASEEGK